MRTRLTLSATRGVFLAISILACGAARAEESRFELIPRATIVAASGEPANDIISLGVAARYRIGGHWLLGAAVDWADFDFEQPAQLLGLRQAGEEAIDATTQATTVSAWLEREWRLSRRFLFFAGAGLGVSSLDIGDASGPLEGSGTFDITTDPGTELIGLLSGGLKAEIGSHFGAELALRVDHHVADWEVTDRVSGRRVTLDDYTAFGGHIGLSLRF